MSIMNLLYILIVACVVLIIAKFLLHLTPKKLYVMIVNIVFSLLVIWILNYFGIIAVPINWITILLVGILGIPGVLFCVVLVLLGIL